MILRHQFLNLSFKIPYTFFIGIQNNRRNRTRIMCRPRHCKKIFNSVIIFQAIKMVDKPAFRQWLAKKVFPYLNMLHNITTLMCSRMFTAKNFNIAVYVSSPTSPSWRLFSNRKSSIATPAHFVLTIFKHWLPTFRARHKAFFAIPYPTLFAGAIITSLLARNYSHKYVITNPAGSSYRNRISTFHTKYFTLIGEICQAQAF